MTAELLDKVQNNPLPPGGGGLGWGGGCHDISLLHLHPPPNPLPAREGESISKTFARALTGTVIIGMGNPLLSDDGVGITVAHAVAERLKRSMNLTVTELHTGGIRLMEAMAGFRRAVVVDAMLSGALPGTVRNFETQDFVTTKNTFSSHDTDFETAYDLGIMTGVPLPEQFSFWGIEADEFDLFGERLTDRVAAAVPEAVERIVAQIIKWEGAA